jgi:hypothetical protein
MPQAMAISPGGDKTIPCPYNYMELLTPTPCPGNHQDRQYRDIFRKLIAFDSF